jgi:tight adherence protein B
MLLCVYAFGFLMKNPQQIIELGLALSTFALVLSLWIAGMLLWGGRQAARSGKVRRRLGLEKSQPAGERILHLWHEGQDLTTTVPVGQRSISWPRRIEQQFQKADLPLRFGQIVVLLLGIALISIAFMLVVSGNPLLSIGVAGALLVIMRIYILARIASREALFETQLVDALELAARSLRAGHPLLGAFQLLSSEMAPPVSTVFADLCQQHGMGADLEQVLREAGEESASDDMKLFATSVAIQIRTGGNLADLMERLALVIRDRMRVHRRVRVLTAQTQMSKRVLIALPFVLFVVLNVIKPSYMDPLYVTSAGKFMLGAAVFLLLSGTWIMNRMVALKY